ncbi:MAG: hypothetical protein PHP62_04030 [Candidatus Moranbacteria bacterium]|nr:hypothetical protein [Candidatus Moranbacteria bacterium]
MSKRKIEKTALEIRIRLVRDVAGREIKAREYAREITTVTEKLNVLEKENVDMLEKLGLKLKCRIPTEELNMEVMEEVKREYEKFSFSYHQRRSVLLKEKEEFIEMKRAFSSKAQEVFNSILNEIKNWEFGRGDIIFSAQGISRVFGIIKELGESYHCSGYFLHRDNYVSSDDVKKIAEACAGNQQPLIHVSNIALMPLNQDEVDAICCDNVSYDSLKKLIPKEMFPWRMPFVYLMRSDYNKEIFIAPLNENEVAILQVDTMDFPVRRAKVIGKVRRDEENLREIPLSSFGDMLADKIQKIGSKEKVNILKNLQNYYERKYPGVIFTKK